MSTVTCTPMWPPAPPLYLWRGPAPTSLLLSFEVPVEVRGGYRVPSTWTHLILPKGQEESADTRGQGRGASECREGRGGADFGGFSHPGGRGHGAYLNAWRTQNASDLPACPHPRGPVSCRPPSLGPPPIPEGRPWEAGLGTELWQVTRQLAVLQELAPGHYPRVALSTQGEALGPSWGCLKAPLPPFFPRKSVFLSDACV